MDKITKRNHAYLAEKGITPGRKHFLGNFRSLSISKLVNKLVVLILSPQNQKDHRCYNLSIEYPS